MEWSLEHDVILMREILFIEPYKFKKGSNERGRLWTQVAECLNKVDEVKFKVKQRGVRERFEGLQSKYLEKIKNEERATGISPEQTELDQLIEEITEKERQAEATRETEDQTKKGEREREVAMDIRKKAMETFGETKKRLNEDEESGKSEKRKRRSGSDAVEYLREKSEKEMSLREEELELKRLQEVNRQQHERELEGNRQQQQQLMIDAMKEQQTQMQNMQVMLMQQQQQQTNALMCILDRLTKK